MTAAVEGASERHACKTLAVPRSAVRSASTQPSPSSVNGELADRIGFLIQTYPTYGYRRLWALLRKRHGLHVNRKAVYRILKVKGWMVHQRTWTPRPRVKGWASRASRSNERWAMDLTHIPVGRDGWAHLAAVIDCHDRAIIGHEFSLRGRAKEAERALEDACILRFGTLRPKACTPVLRSDNGLIFQSRRFRAACRDYRLKQEFITPYTPEQNGMIERFFRSLKEECTWLHNFETFDEAKKAINTWIQFYNEERPHQSLGYLSPHEYRAQQRNQVA